MHPNLVIFVIVLVLFIVLTLIGFLIWYLQNGFSRGSRVSETSGEDDV